MAALATGSYLIVFSGRDGALSFLLSRKETSVSSISLSIPLILAYAISIGSALVLAADD